MNTSAQMGRELATSSATRVWIPVGAGLFIVALAVSALVVPQLRSLHVLQALIYVAVVALAHRKSVWAFGAGTAVAVFWNGLQLLVTHNMQAGAAVFWSFLRGGQLRRVDTMMVTVGGIGHFILTIACLVAMRDVKTSKKWPKFIAGGAISLAYFALIVFIALPR